MLKMTHLRRSIKAWDSLSSANVWDSRENLFDLGCSGQTSSWGFLENFHFLEQQQGLGAQGRNGCAEVSRRNCHDKPACLEVRADFEEHYYKRQVGARF